MVLESRWCSNTFNIDDVGYATVFQTTRLVVNQDLLIQKWFLIITYTGNGSAGTISHGLGKNQK